MKITTLPNNNFNMARDGDLTALSGLFTTLLAGVFIVAGILKWNDPAAFHVSILHLDFFPEWSVTSLVYGIPVIEIVLGLLCLSISFRELGCSLLLLLTIAYTALLVVESLRGISAGCGCFGSQSTQWPYWALFTRNLGLLAIEVYLIRADFFQEVMKNLSQRRHQLSQ